MTRYLTFVALLAALAWPEAAESPPPASYPYAHGFAYPEHHEPLDGWLEAGRTTMNVLPAKGTDAYAVAKCESGLDPQAKNPNSTASGLFQGLNGTWTWVTGLAPPARDYPIAVQRAFFRKLWDEGRGWRHWEPSKHCWEKHIDLP